MYGLDLFSGIGGITKALEGYVTPIAYCENDRYAQAVLLSRMGSGDLPNAPVWDDIRTLSGRLLPAIDIVYGGFPCQDISVAGRGAGLAGKRSGLFAEVARLVSELRPRFVFLENVPAIRLRGGSTVVGTLAGLGYDCRWDLLSAAAVGANHKRERWWLLAHSRHWSRRDLGASQRGQDAPQKRSGDNDALGRPSEQSKDVADADHSGCEEQRRRESDGAEHEATQGGSWWESEPNLGRVAHGVPQRVDRLRALGNAVVPAQAREAFERLMGLK